MIKELEIDAYRNESEVFVVLRGRLILKLTQEVKTRLTAVFQPRVEVVYLHLGELTFLDSAGLGVLVGLKMTANKNQSRLVFLAPPSRIEDIFKVSKLDTIFEVRGTVEAEQLRKMLQKDEYCLFRDSRDERQRGFNTEVDFGSETRGNLTMLPNSPQSTDVNPAVRSACDEAAEWLRQHDHAKAVSAYLRALQIEPNNISALNNLGIVYEKRPEWYDRARQTWMRVLELSQASRDEKHEQRAQKHLEQLSKFAPGA